MSTVSGVPADGVSTTPAPTTVPVTTVPATTVPTTTVPVVGTPEIEEKITVKVYNYASNNKLWILLITANVVLSIIVLVMLLKGSTNNSE